jgi:hypothetical protein
MAYMNPTYKVTSCFFIKGLTFRKKLDAFYLKLFLAPSQILKTE